MNVSLLDCTLRDGGYVNNWEFGKKKIKEALKDLYNSNVEIIEIGFLRDEKYNKERTVFNDIKKINEIIPNYCKNKYSAMVEISNPFPITKLEYNKGNGVDIIRVIVWKEKLKESFEYCSAIRDKGYNVCVQPVRTNQYTEKEFVLMCEMFSKIDPYAIYVVDSWGIMDEYDINAYLFKADGILNEGVKLGLHGHNNLQQAFSSAKMFSNLNICRDIIIDSSVYGIGRGAGNLDIELIASYLNSEHGKEYKLNEFSKIYDDLILPIYKEYKWGYSVASYLTSVTKSNPEYGSLFYNNSISATDINSFLLSLSDADKLVFNKKLAMEFLKCKKY